MINNLLKSALEQDRAPIVICDMQHRIVFMNASAVKRYESYGGSKLIGSSLLNCHDRKSVEMILKILTWFAQSRDNNMIYTYKNAEENKDVYMVALRDEEGRLIGYYEKHEYRTPENAGLYDFNKSLI